MKKAGFMLLVTAFFWVGCGECNDEQQTCKEKEDVVIENIMARRSIRKYKPQAVSREVVNELLICGINAPNGRNVQPWEIRVVDNEKMLQSLNPLYFAKDAEAAKDSTFRNIFRNAPTVIFVGNNVSVSTSPIDCGLMIENILLAATAKGLGSIVLASPVYFLKGEPQAADFLNALQFSKGYELLLCIGLGEADETPQATPRDASKIRYID